MQIKALAPMLGEFRGKGNLMDGTEILARFTGQEIIPSLCYGLRFELTSSENHGHIVNAFILVSLDKKSGGLDLQLIDTKENLHDLKYVESQGAEAGSHTHAFKAQRASGGLYQIEFRISSSAEFEITLIISSAAETVQKRLWSAKLERSLSGSGGASEAHTLFAA